VEIASGLAACPRCVPRSQAAEAAGLQFDRAETAQPVESSEACAICRKALADAYFLAGGARVCAGCREEIRKALAAGSPAKRFLKAALLGSLGALVGAVVYFVVAIWIEIGIVAIFVGWLVGVAVRKGSEGRGGWPYQAMAMFLTYAAIIVIYVPSAMERQMDSIKHEKAVAAEKAKESGAPAPAEEKKPITNPLIYPIILIFVFVVACIEPFRQGAQNFIGLLLIGIALYEAWKLNRRVRLDFQGPFKMGSTLPPAGGAGG
jgi:hypothetical protein